MKECLLYSTIGNNIKCEVCNRYCIIKEGDVGHCKIRKNIDGKLYNILYNILFSSDIEPMEKKVLYNFYPNNKVMTFSSYGCNFDCSFCINWPLTKVNIKDNIAYFSDEYIKYKQIEERRRTKKTLLRENNNIADVIKKNKFVAFSFNEMTTNYEMVVDYTKIAVENGVVPILVTNGYTTKEANKGIIDAGIGAVNQDIKSLNENFYKYRCGTSLEPVLKTAIQYKKAGVHLEISHVVLEQGYKVKKIKELCVWVIENLGRNTPIHFQRYIPHGDIYKVQTKLSTLRECLRIAKKEGLYYPYIQNIRDDVGTSTYCPHCHRLLLKRIGYQLIKNKITNDKLCYNCGYDLSNDIIGEINTTNKYHNHYRKQLSSYKTKYLKKKV